MAFVILGTARQNVMFLETVTGLWLEHFIEVGGSFWVTQQAFVHSSCNAIIVLSYDLKIMNNAWIPVCSTQNVQSFTKGFISPLSTLFPYIIRENHLPPVISRDLYAFIAKGVFLVRRNNIRNSKLNYLLELFGEVIWQALLAFVKQVWAGNHSSY